MKIIDCYGWSAAIDTEKFLTAEKPAAETDDSTSGVTYIRYTAGTASEPITRVSVSGGVTTIRWAYGLWTNRANLTYATAPGVPLAVED